MGDLIHIGATFNEPNLSTVVRWGGMVEQYRPFLVAMQQAGATATNSPNWSSPMIAGEAQFDGVIAAHEAAIDAIRTGGGRFPVGLTLAITADRPAGPDSAPRFPLLPACLSP